MGTCGVCTYNSTDPCGDIVVDSFGTGIICSTQAKKCGDDQMGFFGICSSSYCGEENVGDVCHVIVHVQFKMRLI